MAYHFHLIRRKCRDVAGLHRLWAGILIAAFIVFHTILACFKEELAVVSAMKKVRVIEVVADNVESSHIDRERTSADSAKIPVQDRNNSTSTVANSKRTHIPTNFAPQKQSGKNGERNDEKEDEEEELLADPSTKSPFEIRWPDWDLPRWASKDENVHTITVPERKRMCFVHVGKTGGSTAGCALGFRLHCNGESYINGTLSRYTTHMFHTDINDCPEKTANYLFIVRNPLRRLQSLYVYERSRQHRSSNGELNQAKLYDTCPFWTLNELALNGLAPEGNASAVCKERAYNHVRGIEQFGYHSFFNYQYYYNSVNIDESSKIFVVRTEHLVQDWNDIESMLGSNTTGLVEDLGHFNPSKKYSSAGDSYMSEMSQRLLCNALCEEIQMYKKILREAVNLKDGDIKASYDELAFTCPQEAQMTNCSDEASITMADPGTVSPYETRFPEWELPWWASKDHNVRVEAVPENKRICFIHVGKTAGSTMGCALGFRLHCNGDSYIDGLLSRYTTHMFHNSINDCPSKTDNYLFAVRNPLRRIQSAYVYERSEKHRKSNGDKGQAKIYDECPFWTLNELAENGLAPEGNATALCKERAYMHIRGIERFSYHPFHNYQFYYNNLDIDNTTRIFVVRTEHLVDDWNRIESILGNDSDHVENFSNNNPSAKYADEGDSFLSETSQRLLCEALCEEILMYKKIINDAVNLSVQDIADTLQDLESSCPLEAQLDTCS